MSSISRLGKAPSVVKSEGRALLKQLDAITSDTEPAEELYSLSLFSKYFSIRSTLSN